MNDCYRIYQGAILGLTPLLDHRPKMQVAFKKALTDTAKMRSLEDKAFALRGVMDAALKEMRRDIAAKGKPSLWDRLGGEKAVRAVVHDFVVRAASDPKVNFDRGGAFKLDEKAVEMLEQRLVELVSAVGGGPLQYKGRDMKTSHKGMKITNAEFDALAGHLVAVLKKYKVPQKEMDELLGAIGATRKDIVEEKTKASLYERLGGEAAITAVVDDFVKRTAGNPKVNFTRKGTDLEWEASEANITLLKKRLVQFVAQVTGGPRKYEGRDMKTAHRGMKITSAEFDAIAGDLKATLEKFKVPAAEQKELLDLVGTTRDAIVEKK